jgi:ADP-ribose pyrophosphatase YjhB (NUDIX family)
LRKKRYSGVIVKCNDKVLLCKRNNDGSLPGEWSIPGGKIEIDETPIDGAVREFYEETNLEIVSPITLCGMLKRHTRDGKNVKGLMYTFLMETDSEMIDILNTLININNLNIFLRQLFFVYQTRWNRRVCCLEVRSY